MCHDVKVPLERDIELICSEERHFACANTQPMETDKSYFKCSQLVRGVHNFGVLFGSVPSSALQNPSDRVLDQFFSGFGPVFREFWTNFFRGFGTNFR